MKKFKLGKKYVLHTTNMTYECIVKSRNELLKPYSVYVILDVKVITKDSQYKYTRAYRVMDTSFDYECECVELTSDYYGSILTADNTLNDGTLYRDTLQFIEDNELLRAFLIENKCMQLPVENYSVILVDIIKHHNRFYNIRVLASRYDFTFKSLCRLFEHCTMVYDNYYKETCPELLNVLIHDVLVIQLMQGIVDYSKLVHNTHDNKDIIKNMIDIYNNYYNDYISRFKQF